MQVKPNMSFLELGTLTDKPDLNLRVGKEPIERVTSTKYLGVILDDHLTFEEHTSFVYKTASKKLGILTGFT